MLVASIDYNKLLNLTKAVRNYKRLSVKERRELADELLKRADVVARADIENLMCIPCAAKLANYTLAGFRRKAARDLHVYRLCHRVRRNNWHGMRNKGAMIEYVDRREVLEVRKEPAPLETKKHCTHTEDIQL